MRLPARMQFGLAAFWFAYVFQAEIFTKHATDGASARQHLGKPAMLCFISHLAASRRRSILGFRLPIFSGCLLIPRTSAAAATAALFVFRLPCGILCFAAQRV